MDTFFKIRERGSSVSTEIIGGTTTFLAMAYIVAVNPSLMAAAGIPFNAALTSTCLGAAVMTIAMGLIANRPIALASGMGKCHYCLHIQTDPQTGNMAILSVFLQRPW